MTKLEKLMIDVERLRERIVHDTCPSTFQVFGLVDSVEHCGKFPDCERCWNEEVEE